MKPLLNRDFTPPADGFFQVVPKGEWPVTLDVGQARQIKGYPLSTLPAAGTVSVVQNVDDAACSAMLNRFQELAAKPTFAGMLWDYDHFSNDPDKSSEAIAWGTQMVNRADGLYQTVRYAGDGEQKITSGAFRFPSPVWNPSDCEWIGNGRIRPLRLDRIGVTNDPNMKGIKPLSNRSQEPAPAASGTVNPGMSGTIGGSTMDHKTELLALLGLKAEATDADVSTAIANRNKKDGDLGNEIGALRNRATTAETKLADIAKTTLEALVEKDLDAHAAVIVNRAEWKTRLMADRDGTLKLLQGIVKPGQKVLNRAAGTPEARQQTAASVYTSRAGAVRNRAEEIRKTNPGRQWGSCWNQANKEIPQVAS